MIDLRVGLANQREFLFEVQTLNSKISNGWSMFTVPGPVQLPPGLSAPWRCRWAPWLLQGQLPCEWGDFQFWGASELNRTTNHPDDKIQIFSSLCFEHLGNRWVPPPPGMIASRVSVNPILEEYKSNTIFCYGWLSWTWRHCWRLWGHMPGPFPNLRQEPPGKMNWTLFLSLDIWIVMNPLSFL